MINVFIKTDNEYHRYNIYHTSICLMEIASNYFLGVESNKHILEKVS